MNRLYSAWLGGAWLALGCTSNPYYIGSACPPSGGGDPCHSGADAGTGDAGVSFALDLDQSGASHLGDDLELPVGVVRATLRLRGERATATDWPSEQGATLSRGAGSAAPGLDAPFTDATLAVGLAPDAPTYVAVDGAAGSIDGDDAAIEVVLRAASGAAIIDKMGTGSGWSLETTPAGVLSLELRDAQRTSVIVSEPLAAGAWYHCLFWVSRSSGGRCDCNGRPGAANDLAALGSVASSTNLVIGGAGASGADRVELAHLALFRVPVGGLGDASTWSDVGRRRFAMLTGAHPRVARGSAVANSGVRDAPAYVDLDRGLGSGRRLFLVGPDWPRVACRTDAAGSRACGFLAEPDRARRTSALASAWMASELTVSGGRADFADGERRMEGLVASTSNVPHVLGWTGAYAGARQALSFFARADGGQFLGVAVSNRGMAVFDVRAGKVVSVPDRVRATIEPWGNGLFRFAYIFEPDAGSLTYGLHLLDGAGAEPFAGDGATPSIDIAGLQLDVGQANPGSLLAADAEPADQLTFAADDGNFPAASAMSVRCRILLPEGVRLNDQAVLNLNRGGTFENQIQLYVTGDTDLLKFWGLRDNVAHWAFTHPSSPIDGLRHAVEMRWGTTSAELWLDGVPAKQDALIANDPPFSLDRIDIGFSSKSSGALEGLVAGIEIGPL